MKKNNIIFFSNNTRGICVLKKLLENDFKVSLLITSKGKKSLFETFLAKNKIREIKDVNENSFLREIKSLNPSLFLVAGFSQIFKKDLLDIPLYGVLNLHAGPLPKYRGGSPLNWQKINGEKKIGISIIKMDEGIDSGNIIEKTFFENKEKYTIDTLHKKANSLFPELTISAIEKVFKGYQGEMQNNKEACYWHQRNDEDGFIDFRKKSLEIILFIKALTYPYKGAWTIYDDKKLRIFDAEISSLKIKGTQGKIIFLQGSGPYVICADCAIKIIDYKFENNEELKLNHGYILNR